VLGITVLLTVGSTVRLFDGNATVVTADPASRMWKKYNCCKTHTTLLQQHLLIILFS